MAIEFSTKSAALHDHRLKQQRLVLQVSIKADATPADKGHSSDVPGAALLRTEGKTAEADAVEDISATVTTAADATGIFAVLLDVQATKLYKVTATPSAGTVSTTATLLPSGRIAVDVDSSLDLSAADLTLTLEVEYKQ